MTFMTNQIVAPPSFKRNRQKLISPHRQSLPPRLIHARSALLITKGTRAGGLNVGIGKPDLHVAAGSPVEPVTPQTPTLTSGIRLLGHATDTPETNLGLAS